MNSLDKDREAMNYAVVATALGCGFVLLLASIPVMVFLWRWALR